MTPCQGNAILFSFFLRLVIKGFLADTVAIKGPQPLLVYCLQPELCFLLKTHLFSLMGSPSVTPL